MSLKFHKIQLTFVTDKLVCSFPNVHTYKAKYMNLPASMELASC